MEPLCRLCVWNIKHFFPSLKAGNSSHHGLPFTPCTLQSSASQGALFLCNQLSCVPSFMQTHNLTDIFTSEHTASSYLITHLTLFLDLCWVSSSSRMQCDCRGDYFVILWRFTAGLSCLLCGFIKGERRKKQQVCLSGGSSFFFFLAPTEVDSMRMNH